MRPWFLAPVLALLFAPTNAAAQACSCRGASSSAAALTSKTERWALSLSGSAGVAHGVWDAQGKYHSLLPGERYDRESLTFTVAYRLRPNLEFALSPSLVNARVSTPTLSDESSGFGDTHLRARWDVTDSPAFAMLGTISVPGSESESEHAASVGVGAWEVALGAHLAGSLTRAWQLEALVEVAERSPDTTLGFERQLGPRALFQLGTSYALLSELRLGALSTITLEGDASYENRVADGSGQRLWTISAFVSRELPSVHAHASLGVDYAPAVEGIGMNAVADTTLRASLSWAR